MFTATPEQIAKWKKEHGEVFALEGGKTITGKGKDPKFSIDKRAYVKKPDRKVISMAGTLGEGDHIATAEAILDAIWLDGDEEIRTEDEYFLSVKNQINNLIELKEVQLKKL
ncbi:MAG: hypothetical protein H0X62_05910 [Bacteroidetes bacterium]|nr:hypothetical protein [Bacteroidota bacterium]